MQNYHIAKKASETQKEVDKLNVEIPRVKKIEKMFKWLNPSTYAGDGAQGVLGVLQWVFAAFGVTLPVAFLIMVVEKIIVIAIIIMCFKLRSIGHGLNLFNKLMATVIVEIIPILSTIIPAMSMNVRALKREVKDIVKKLEKIREELSQTFVKLRQMLGIAEQESYDFNGMILENKVALAATG